MAKTARIVTPVPGPKFQELLAQREAIVPGSVANVVPVFAASAYGATIIDVDGNTFIDFAGGIGVVDVGHTHPEVNDAIHDEVDKFLHTCFHVTMYESYIRLAEELARLTPGNFPKKTLLVNGGAEAVENAVKIARRFTGCPAVVTFENAYHGRTLLTMSLTAKVTHANTARSLRSGGLPGPVPECLPLNPLPQRLRRWSGPSPASSAWSKRRSGRTRRPP